MLCLGVEWVLLMCEGVDRVEWCITEEEEEEEEDEEEEEEEEEEEGGSGRCECGRSLVRRSLRVS